MANGAILTYEEREQLMNESDNDIAGLICDLERRVNEEFQYDLRILKKREPWLYEDLLNRVIESFED